MSVMELKKAAVHPFAKRFFAGETLEDALVHAAELNIRGMGATLDFLGEDVPGVVEAEAAASEYLRVLGEAYMRGLDCSLAIKLTHIGLAFDRGLATAYALKLAEDARSKGLGLWVDMEGSEHTGATLDIYREMRKINPGTGVALQAMLKRTWDDLRSLVEEGATVRLVKGAYDEPPDIAVDDTRELRDRYIEMMEYLFSHCGRFAIGTHDKGIIDIAAHVTSRFSCEVEFQMLMGLRDDVKRELVSAGRRVVEYVPYGTDWYGYGMRRLMEKKRNALYFAEGLLGR